MSPGCILPGVRIKAFNRKCFSEYSDMIEKETTKEFKKLNKNLPSYNPDYANSLIEIYYQRCKLVHKAAWFQSRHGAAFAVKSFKMIKQQTEEELNIIKEMS